MKEEMMAMMIMAVTVNARLEGRGIGGFAL